MEQQGLHKDEGKLRVDLVPFEAIKGIADVMGYGCQKYAPRNWEKGISYSRVYASALRHLLSWFFGQNIDTESGLPHLSHALCNISFLLYYQENKMTKLDDRPGVTHGEETPPMLAVPYPYR